MKDVAALDDGDPECSGLEEALGSLRIDQNLTETNNKNIKKDVPAQQLLPRVPKAYCFRMI